ncbi:MAG TPA: calcium-binding protein [Solirubrobacterales bacterium]|nr:calcium-binding protein [Solirubrobacterales bacterium]
MAGAACLSVALMLSSGTASGNLDRYGEGCEYVEAGPPGPKGNRLLVVGGGEPRLRRIGDALVVREGSIGCDRTRVPVDSVDRVVFRAEDTSVTVDERGGRLGPGATLERGGSSEIEVEVHEADFFSLYRGPEDSVTRIGVGPKDTVAFNLNPAGDGRRRDPDVLLSKDGFRRMKVFAGGGDDLIDARRLTGIPDNHIGFPVIRLNGGKGRDAILGGPEAEGLYDGPGDDLIRGAGGDDLLGLSTGSETAYGGFGEDALVYTTPLEVAGGHRDAADRLFAGPGADTVQDDNGYPDVIRCGPGRDILDAHGRDRGRSCERVLHGRGDII